MRKTFDPQSPLGATPIEKLTFNPKSRDDTEVLCYALQALWCETETRDDVLALIQESHGETINGTNGRPGMDFWQILVFAVMKQGLDIDFDRLANNISLLDDDVLAQINRVIVQLGHKTVGHAVDARLAAGEALA